jgi:phage gp29-like protein
MNPIPETSYPDLISLINQTYTDRVEQILSAGVDEAGNIICLAQDGSKQLAIEITDTDIKIKLFSPTEQPTPSTTFAATPDPIDPILTQLKPIGDATFQDWFLNLQSLMQDSDNLTDFQTKLTTAYPDLDAAEFKQAMLDASVVAGMQGYADADNHH